MKLKEYDLHQADRQDPLVLLTSIPMLIIQKFITAVRTYGVGLALLTILSSSCSGAKWYEKIDAEVAKGEVFGLSAEAVEGRLDLEFITLYEYVLDGARHEGRQHRNFVFVYDNDALCSVASEEAIDDSWSEALAVSSAAPFRGLIEIHEQLEGLPRFVHGEVLQSYKFGNSIADGLVIAIAIPFIVIAGLPFYIASKVFDVSEKWPVDPAKFRGLSGRSRGEIIARLGVPITEYTFDSDYTILAFNEPSFWIPAYVGFEADRAVWVQHRAFSLKKHLASLRSRAKKRRF